MQKCPEESAGNGPVCFVQGPPPGVLQTASQVIDLLVDSALLPPKNKKCNRVRKLLETGHLRKYVFFVRVKEKLAQAEGAELPNENSITSWRFC